MKKMTLLAATAVLLFSGCSGDKAKAPASLDEALALAAQKNVPVLLDFFSPT